MDKLANNLPAHENATRSGGVIHSVKAVSSSAPTWTRTKNLLIKRKGPVTGEHGENTYFHRVYRNLSLLQTDSFKLIKTRSISHLWGNRW